MKIHVLVVEDDPSFRAMLRHNLLSAGFALTEVGDGRDALDVLAHTDNPRGAVDIIVSDVMMPVMDGLSFLRAVRADPKTRELPFMFLTARGESADKLEGFRSGADDYLTKPFNIDELLARMHVLARRARLTRGVRDMLVPEREAPTPRHDLGDLYAKVSLWEQRFPALASIRSDVIVGGSRKAVLLLRDILLHAPTRDVVLVEGETGTGKTGVADALHRLGPRADKPFRVVNCAELAAADPMLSLSRLFGIGRGSGLAHVPREGQPGLLEDADGGTVFFDEVHRLPPAAQGQLLLVAEGRPFRPAAGKAEDRVVDVKLLFATNLDLKAEALAGRFPFDLYQRLAQGVIRVPSLAQRRDDIAPLAEHFLDECRAEFHLDHASFAPSLRKLLVERDWPGNIRELKAFVRTIARVAAFEQDNVLTLDHLPPSDDVMLPGTAPPPEPVAHGPAPAPEQAAPAVQESDRIWNAAEMKELAALRRHRFRIMRAELELGYSEKSRTLTTHLRGLCLKALALHDFDIARASRAVVGRDDDALLERTKERLGSYLGLVARHVDAHTVDVLRDNLQLDYRKYVDRAVDRARGLGHGAEAPHASVDAGSDPA